MEFCNIQCTSLSPWRGEGNLQYGWAHGTHKAKESRIAKHRQAKRYKKQRGEENSKIEMLKERQVETKEREAIPSVRGGKDALQERQMKTKEKEAIPSVGWAQDVLGHERRRQCAKSTWEGNPWSVEQADNVLDHTKSTWEGNPWSMKQAHDVLGHKKGTSTQENMDRVSEIIR